MAITNFLGYHLRAEAMMRNRKPALILLVIILGISSFGCSESFHQEATPAAGQQQEQAGTEDSTQPNSQIQWWRNQSILDELGLTDDQVRAIQDIMTAGTGDGKMQRQQERRLTLRYFRVLNQETYDAAQADELGEKLSRAIAGDKRRRIENIRAIRDILTIDQWNELWEVAPQLFEIGRVRVRLGPKITVTEDGGPAPTPAP